MGSLTIVGSGLRVAGQLTREAMSAVETADKLFYCVEDIASQLWFQGLHETAESLATSYEPGKPRARTYEEMVERMLAPVRQGQNVCAVFYGHPGVFATPPHEAIRRARAEGHSATMLPGISAEDCLFADVGFDPGIRGCQSFEATDFLLRRRRFDPASVLVLWQIGAIGVHDFRPEECWNREGIGFLARTLAQAYGDEHEVVVYEAAVYPIAEPLVHKCPLRELENAPITIISTLYVPPLSERPVDPELSRLLTRMSRRGTQVVAGGTPTIFVSDLARARRFYTGVLGLNLVKAVGSQGVLVDAGEGLVLNLRLATDRTPKAGSSGAVSLGLRSATPLEDAVEKLRERGLEFLGPIRGEGSALRLAFFRDPDGNRLYLYQSGDDRG